MKYLSFCLLLIISLVSCENGSTIEDDISKVKIELKIDRFDKAFAKVGPENWKVLREEYPFMFSNAYPDTFWENRIQDTLQHELSVEVLKAYPEMKAVEPELLSLFQHLKYYYPEFIAPRIVTTTSYVDYRNKVIVTDSIDLIALDTYLGPEHEFYQGVQEYIRQGFKSEQIVVDVADAYAERYILQTRNKTLLDEMIAAGKRLYFKDLMIPFKTEAERINYSETQLKWAQHNEAQIWQYFIERELLYSSDSKLPGRFINPAPFSKFYLAEIDNESPGRIGQYIGWQIVRAYMEHNPDISFKAMFSMSAEDIFNNSKFKPRK